MRLKSIKIFGFKSFADKLEIDVDGNLVAVVGPNGCGKSNIVDAIQWALGEPSARNLRAGQATDVIFSGSSRRRALGYAEVSLVFDNEDGSLPVATTEVVVTRKLDRKGESTYLINRHACRLKDIYELFADSGLGRTGYAVVSQKDIDAALSAPPEERRIWIDEAAGVQRYRTRKVEALRRLESALQHLQRVNDVVLEIENQREPLREQAEAAKLYKQALASLREVESGLLLKEAADLGTDISRLEASILVKRTNADRKRKSVRETDEESLQIALKISEVELLLDSLRAAVQSISTTLERALSKKALAEQRLKSLDELNADSGREAEAAKERVARAENAADATQRDADAESVAVEQLLTLIQGSVSNARALADELADADKKLADARTAQVQMIEQAAKLAQAAERKEKLAREAQDASAALPDLQKGEAEAELSLESAKAALSEARTGEQRLAEDRRLKADGLRTIEEERRDALTERARLDGRMEGLRATLESFEGLPSGARMLLSAAKEGRVLGDFLPVSSAVQAPAKIALAIESALGASAGDLITSHSKHAKAAIELLKAEGLGRATFLAADLVNPRPRQKDIDSLLKKGALGVAADMVSCKKEHTAAIELLLGGVVIVQDLDTATRLAKEPGYRKIATLEGEVVFGGGAVSGGRNAKQAAGPIRMKAQLGEAEERHSQLDKTIADLEAQVDQVVAEDTKATAEADDLRSDTQAKETEVAEAIHWLTAVREERAATERSVAKLETELAETESLLAASAGSNERYASVEELEAERNRLLSAAAAMSADSEQAKRSLNEGRERLENAKARLSRALVELEEARAYDRSRESRIGNLGAEREQQERQIGEAAAEAENLKSKMAAKQQELEGAQDRRRQLLEQSSTNASAAKTLQEEARVLEDSAYADDIARARAETKRAAGLARLLEEYAVNEDEASEQAPLVELPPDAQRLAGRLRREIRELGDVNVGAIEAFERLTERFDILTLQREDILESKAELDRSVGELDRLTRGAFAETFDKVNDAFGEMFADLFGGGEAKLILTDPEHILETGVDV
ncbi:MAG: chromosome segregation protein SMC, partial [Armatimonadetes bacterium]|nr:chromosome segregation protein SMC [Armatimonadota bacterium]